MSTQRDGGHGPLRVQADSGSPAEHSQIVKLIAAQR